MSVSSGAESRYRLVGREGQQRALPGLITNARNGRSGSLLIHGEPGIGKTALLQDVAVHAAGVQVVPLVGFEAESSIPFGGLQRLAAPLGEHLDALPARQQQALMVAEESSRVVDGVCYVITRRPSPDPCWLPSWVPSCGSSW
jgi:AAA ATPase domain